MKAQISMEYLIVFGITLAMALPLILIFAVQTENVRSDITRVEMQKISLKIIDYAEEVYFMGPPSQKTLTIDFPAGVQNVTISNTIVRFNITTSDYDYALVREGMFNMSGNIKSHQGLHIIVFKAQNDSVLISDQ